MKLRCLVLLASVLVAACSAPSTPPPNAGVAGGVAGGASAGSIRVSAALITITLIMRPGSEAKAVAIGTLLLQRMGISTRQ